MDRPEKTRSIMRCRRDWVWDSGGRQGPRFAGSRFRSRSDGFFLVGRVPDAGKHLMPVPSCRIVAQAEKGAGSACFVLAARLLAADFEPAALKHRETGAEANCRPGHVPGKPVGGNAPVGRWLPGWTSSASQSNWFLATDAAGRAMHGWSGFGGGEERAINSIGRFARTFPLDGFGGWATGLSAGFWPVSGHAGMGY